jgi:WD40 repeat protein
METDLALVIRNGIKSLGPPTSQYTYQTTAISSSCSKIALVGRADFRIYQVSSAFDTTFLCWGDINKRYAHQAKLAIEINSPLAYHRSALSDEILAIASVKSVVDIRNARTGQRIRQLTFEPDVECSAIAFSPDGQSLGIGLENGDLLVYEAGLRLDFASRHIRVPQVDNIGIAAIAFSPDSLLMAATTLDSSVVVYRVSNLSTGYLENFVKPMVYGKRSEPADITDVD